MNKKILVCIALLMIFSLVFVACEEHEHTFDTEWSSNATYHWHAATCVHEDVKADDAAHTFIAENGNVEKCEVCGYVKQNTDTHRHTYAEKWSNDASYHWRVATCEHSTEVADYAAHEYQNGVCKYCGVWQYASEVILNGLANLDVWKYTVTFNNVDLTGIDGFVGELDNLTVNYGELNISFDDGKKIQGYGYFDACSYEDVIVNGNSVRQQRDIELKAVVKDSVLYIYGSGLDNSNEIYMRFNVIDIFAQNGVDLDTIENVLSEINSRTFEIYQYYTQIKETLENFWVDDDALKRLLDTLVKIDEEKSVNGETVYVLSYDVWRTLNETLATVTVSQYVDGMFGEGFYDAIPALIENAFKMKIGDLLDALEENGYSLDDIIAALNAAIDKNYPDPEIKTIEDLLKANGVDMQGVTVKELINSSRIFTLAAVWDMAQQNSPNKISAEQAVEMIAQYCLVLKDFTIYDLALQGNEQFTPEIFKAVVDKAIDTLESYLTVEFHLGADKSLKSVSINAQLPQASAPSEDDENISDEQVVANAFAEQIKRYLSVFSGQLSIVKDYKSQQDYTEVAQKVDTALAVISLPEDSEAIKRLANAIVNPYGDDGILVTGYNVTGNKIEINYLTNDSYLAYNDRIEVRYTVDYTVSVDFAKSFNVMARLLCDNKLELNIEIIPKVVNVSDARFVFYIANKETGMLEQSAPLTLSEAKTFVSDSEYFKNADLDLILAEHEINTSAALNAVLYYDVATKTFVTADDCAHDLRLVESECVYSENCGEYDKLVYKCEVCNKIVVEYQERTHEFDYNNPIYVLKGSSCQDGAEVYFECLKCGQNVYLYDYTVLDHEFDPQVQNRFEYIDAALGCEGGVNEIGTCLRCNSEFVISMYAGHNYDYENPSYNVLKDSCCDGVEVKIVCTMCQDEILINTLYDHHIVEIDIVLPDGCCDNHIMHVFMCDVCDKSVGFQYDNMTEADGGMAGVYECKTCNLKIDFDADLVLIENYYYLSTTNVTLNGEVIWSKQHVSYVGSGNSYPPDRQPEDL